MAKDNKWSTLNNRRQRIEDQITIQREIEKRGSQVYDQRFSKEIHALID